MRHRLALTLLLLTGCERCDSPTRAAYVFDDEAVITGLDAPTSMSFAKDGSLFIAQKKASSISTAASRTRSPLRSRI